MALGSSSPPEIRTEGVRPEKSDTEMEFVPENENIVCCDMNSECDRKSVLSVEQGLFEWSSLQFGTFCRNCKTMLNTN